MNTLVALQQHQQLVLSAFRAQDMHDYICCASTEHIVYFAFQRPSDVLVLSMCMTSQGAWQQFTSPQGQVLTQAA